MFALSLQRKQPFYFRRPEKTAAIQIKQTKAVLNDSMLVKHKLSNLFSFDIRY